MPSKTPGKRTARMTPVTTGTKRRAAIEKRQRAVTLITGGTGFLGSHLVRQLIEDGAKDIRVMATSIPDWLVDLGVETFAGSITNADDNKRAVEGISEIYHLAGKVSREREDAREMYDIHVEGTRLLCDAAKAAGVKTIVLASTSGTIAVTKDGEVIPDETYPRSARHHFALALLREQSLPGDGGARTFPGQRPAAGDHESESAAGPGRRSSQFNQTHSRFHGAEDRRSADRRREFCRRARCGYDVSSGDEERTARRALSARRGKLDLFEILWTAGAI